MRKTLKEQLPENFAFRMEELLKEEYEAFLNSYDEKTYAGLRMNTLKITPEEYEKMERYEWYMTSDIMLEKELVDEIIK